MIQMKIQIIVNSILVILTFFIALFGNVIMSKFYVISIPCDSLKMAYRYVWWVVPTVIVAGLLFGFHKILKNIRFGKAFLSAILFSVVVTLPMFIGSAITSSFRSDANVSDIINKTLFAGFFEEYLFRGFLFGLLFFKLKWGFIPASLLGALIFGLAHIYQGNTISETTGVFFVTALGAIWYAWLYVEWDSLWVPVFLHALMNLSWALFDVSDTALGGLYPNLFRIITVALTIILTIRHNKHHGWKIKKNVLFIHQNNR